MWVWAGALHRVHLPTYEQGQAPGGSSRRPWERDRTWLPSRVAGIVLGEFQRRELSLWNLLPWKVNAVWFGGAPAPNKGNQLHWQRLAWRPEVWEHLLPRAGKAGARHGQRRQRRKAWWVGVPVRSSWQPRLMRRGERDPLRSHQAACGQPSVRTSVRGTEDTRPVKSELRAPKERAGGHQRPPLSSPRAGVRLGSFLPFQSTLGNGCLEGRWPYSEDRGGCDCHVAFSLCFEPQAVA